MLYTTGLRLIVKSFDLMSNLSFNIVGAGAIGHLWTCFLDKHDINARLYSRKHAEPKLIQVESTQSFECLVNYYQLDHWQNADVILICVKAHQLNELCQSLVNKVPKTCPIILMMNGMGLVEIVKNHFPENPVIHASIVHGAFLTQETLVHTGFGITLLGNINSHYSKKNFREVIQTLDCALPDVKWNDYHRQAMNLKLIINAIINPVTATLGVKNGEILIDGELHPTAEDLLLELAPLLKQLLPQESIDEIRSQIIQIAENTQNNTSSMLQDILNKKPTEIDYINGYLVEVAKKSSLQLPRHCEIINQIKQLSEF